MVAHWSWRVTHQAGRAASRPLAAAIHAPSMEGVASMHGVQNPMSPQVLTKLSRPPPVHSRTAARYLPWFD